MAMPPRGWRCQAAAQARPPVRSRAKSAIAFGFRTQLSELMALLGSCTAHYVRALNPNSHRRPFAFQSKLVRQQLANNGVLVRKASIP
jgi:myosin heavy subunit